MEPIFARKLPKNEVVHFKLVAVGAEAASRLRNRQGLARAGCKFVSTTVIFHSSLLFLGFQHRRLSKQALESIGLGPLPHKQFGR